MNYKQYIVYREAYNECKDTLEKESKSNKSIKSKLSTFVSPNEGILELILQQSKQVYKQSFIQTTLKQKSHINLTLKINLAIELSQKHNLEELQAVINSIEASELNFTIRESVIQDGTYIIVVTKSRTISTQSTYTKGAIYRDLEQLKSEMQKFITAYTYLNNKSKIA